MYFLVCQLPLILCEWKTFRSLKHQHQIHTVFVGLKKLPSQIVSHCQMYIKCPAGPFIYIYIYIYVQSTDLDHSRILLRKPRIHTQSSRIAQPNLSHQQQQTQDRSRTQSSSAIRINDGTIDRTRKAVWPSAEEKPRLIVELCTLIGKVCAYNYTL